MTAYSAHIREVLETAGRPELNPLAVEAWMRLERGTLDALTRAAFAREVAMAVRCIDASSVTETTALQASYGLLTPDQRHERGVTR